MTEPVYAPIVWFCKAAIGLMNWRVSVAGVEHIPATGPAILAPNHIGYLDPVLLGYAADLRGRYVRFLAKHELWEFIGFNRMLTQMRHIPVERGADRGRSIEAALRLLADSQIVGVFPESSVTVSFVPAEGRSGAAHMALRSGAPLVPVGIWGSQRIFTKHRPRNLQRAVALTVAIGAPVGYAAGDDPQAVTARLMERIRGLVAQLVADYPQQPAGPDDRWWLPRYVGGTAPSEAEAAELRSQEAAHRRAAG